MLDSGQVFGYIYCDPGVDFDCDSPPNLAKWQVNRVYRDRGDRQQLHQLLQDCRTEFVVYLVVRRLEDLGDSLAAVCDCLDQLESLGLSLLIIDTAASGEKASQQPSEPQPVRPAQILQQLQSLQTYHHRQQLRRGHARNRVKALPPPGRAPYGYRRGKDRYLLDRSTAPVVKDFFDHFLLYGSLRSSVRYVQKKYGKKLSVSTGKRWLTSPVYRGDLLYHTGEVIQDTHMPILPREEAAQVDRLLRRNRQMSPRTASAPRSLSGLVGCGACGSAMKISRVVTNRKAQPKEYLYLAPVACPQQPVCRALPYPQVLERTIQQICQDLSPAVNAATLPPVETIKQQINAEISAKQAVLEKLPPLVETGILDAETADLRAYKLRTEIAALQRNVAQLPPVNLKAIAQVASIPQFWLDLSEAERRFYFREFIRQIQILRGSEDWQIQLVFIF